MRGVTASHSMGVVHNMVLYGGRHVAFVSSLQSCFAVWCAR